MARRRHLLNPAKVKADFEAIDQPKTPVTSAGWFGLHRKLTVALLNVLTAVVMAVSFPLVTHWPISGEWYLAYVGLVPWTLALAGSGSGRWALAWSFIGALLFWSTMYWLTWVTLVGYFPLILACSVFWLAAAIVIRAALRRNWPMWIVLPVVWVALEYGRAYTMTGYTWYNLSLSQYTRTGLLQICDLTGHYGVSFFVGMVNGTIVDLCLAPWRGRVEDGPKLAARVLPACGATLAALGILVSYGAWRISQSSRTTTPGPVIGIVQQDFPISLDSPSTPAIRRIGRHVGLTRAALKGTGCELVIWPETMLPQWVNPEMLQADIATMDVEKLRAMASMILGRDNAEKYDPQTLRKELTLRLQRGGRFKLANGTIVRVHSARDYACMVADMAAELECPLLAGATTGHPNPDPVDRWDHWVMRNSALWFEPVSPSDPRYPQRYLAAAQYAKRHPVPFSESVPFKRGWPWLHNVLRSFVPPSMPQLDAGTERTRFTLKRSDASGKPPWRLAVAICFEGTFARRCREVVMQDGAKVADVLVNLSNDGWFVHKRGENFHDASTEHMQHLAMYCFRAVENRVPVVRAVNTGISASIDSNGRLVAMIQRFDGQTNVPGALLLGGRSVDGRDLSQRNPPPQTAERVLVDDRVSPYSVIGDVFAVLVAVAALAVAVVLVIKARAERRSVRKTCGENEA